MSPTCPAPITSTFTNPERGMMKGGDAGMRNLSSFIHAKGLKFGLCESPLQHAAT